MRRYNLPRLVTKGGREDPDGRESWSSTFMYPIGWSPRNFRKVVLLEGDRKWEMGRSHRVAMDARWVCLVGVLVLAINSVTIPTYSPPTATSTVTSMPPTTTMAINASFSDTDATAPPVLREPDAVLPSTSTTKTVPSDDVKPDVAKPLHVDKQTDKYEYMPPRLVPSKRGGEDTVVPDRDARPATEDAVGRKRPPIATEKIAPRSIPITSEPVKTKKGEPKMATPTPSKRSKPTMKSRRESIPTRTLTPAKPSPTSTSTETMVSPSQQPKATTTANETDNDSYSLYKYLPLLLVVAIIAYNAILVNVGNGDGASKT